MIFFHVFEEKLNGFFVDVEVAVRKKRRVRRSDDAVHRLHVMAKMALVVMTKEVEALTKERIRTGKEFSSCFSGRRRLACEHGEQYS